VEIKGEIAEKNGMNAHMMAERRWANIRVPRSLLAALGQLKRSPKEAWWVVIARLASIASGVNREYERRFWYQFKVVNGWAYVKTAFELRERGLVDVAFVNAQRERFIETVREVRSRVRSKSVDSAAAALVAKLERMVNPTGRDIAEANDLVKQLCLYIMTLDGVA